MNYIRSVMRLDFYLFGLYLQCKLKKLNKINQVSISCFTATLPLCVAISLLQLSKEAPGQ